ncbi:MAG: TatD family hydrolase [Spirochaetaceae bacterium]|jgi:TatD DNase family protein|nr:TatD family hydrolase [Spirochaetaceae bacterium]
MALLYTDTHAHLSLLDTRGLDSHALLGGLFKSGFGTIIDVSLESGDLAARIGAFSRYPAVRFASGLWPHEQVIRDRYRLVPILEGEINAAPPGMVCALGEFGLDHHRTGEQEQEDPTGERELMEMQLDLAQRLSLPVIIHSRDAPRETAGILAAYPAVRGLIHCFSYGPAEAGAFLDLGYYISFAGNLTYKNASHIRESCAMVPRDRLLLETDCPFLAPVPCRGKPAHPGMVEEVYKLAAELRHTDIHTLAEQIAGNTGTLFGLRTKGAAESGSL